MRAQHRSFRRVLYPVIGALLISTTTAAYAQNLPTRHIYEEVQNGQARPVGRLPATQSLHFNLTLALGDPDGLRRFLNAVYDRSNPLFRHFISPEEFTSRFGPTQEEYEDVMNFAQAHGFRVLGGSRHEMNIQLEGTVAAIESAFHVTMRTFQHPTENRTFFSADQEPTTDQPLALWHISGLDNFSTPHAGAKPFNNADHPSTVASTGSAPNGNFYSSDFRSAYYGGTLTGTGWSVGLFEFSPYSPTDVVLTFLKEGQTPPTNVVGVPVGAVTTCESNGIACPSGNGEPEAIVDIVQVAAMAPGLSAIHVYVAPNNASEAEAVFSKMATNTPLDYSLSSSWTWTPPDPATDDVYFQRFAAQGQTYFQASTDYAAYDVPNSYRDVYPADSPYVTSVGGTALATTGPGGTWSSETAVGVYECNLPTQPVYYCGSGGGISPDGFAIPAWQQLGGVLTFADGASSGTGGSMTVRNSPDVAASWGPIYLCYSAGLTYSVCSDTQPTTAITTPIQYWAGTSLAAPMWAGYMALVDEQVGAVGMLNPAIYAVGARGGSAYSSGFHDITVGDNVVNGVGYYAQSGYNLVTGWGSPNGNGLANIFSDNLALMNATPASLYFTTTSGASSVRTATITSTLIIPGCSGTTATLTASGVPAGATVEFNPSTLVWDPNCATNPPSASDPQTASSTMTITLGESVPFNTVYNITVTADVAEAIPYSINVGVEKVRGVIK
jgi:subtilase family serine protease